MDDRRRGDQWFETTFWFEEDEDYLLLRFAGMFEGKRPDVGTPLLLEHKRQKPEQIDMGFENMRDIKRALFAQRK